LQKKKYIAVNQEDKRMANNLVKIKKKKKGKGRSQSPKHEQLTKVKIDAAHT
jgi:hypothetical protein